jgi:type IV secretory pathway VirB2 component (pilin)
MKKLLGLYFLTCARAYSITSNVRDQQPTTLFNGLNKHIKTEVALPVAIISITIVGLYFIIGKQDASEKLSNIAIGLTVIACGAAFASWFF